MTLPGSALLDPALKGHTQPRLFTPPLPSNCDTSRADGCECGCGLNPDTSWGFECISFLEGVLRWKLIPYQRWLYIHALEKDAAGIAFRFETLVILIARQNGKTQWLKGLGLWKLYLDGAEQVLITAQNLELAETTLSEAVADVKANRLLFREYRRFSQTNGKFKLVLKPRPDDPLEKPREWRTTPTTRKGGRSLSVDLAMLDELREHQNWQAWNAITPTTQARPKSLVVAASNAGDAASVVLRSLRDGSLQKLRVGDTEETQTGLFEWSVPDDVDFAEPQYWPMANPALGYLPGFTLKRLVGKLEAMQADNLAGFKTEYLCMWVDALEPGIFPAEHWKATTDEKSRRAPNAMVWASVDVNFERSRAYVAVWALRSDGRYHFEVAKAERGTDWIVDWFKERTDRFENVVVQARGAPASGLIEELREAGVPVAELGGADLTRAYGYFYDLLVEHKAMHRPSPVLDAAAAVAKARTLGDAWVVDRKGSPVDVSPLVACIQAAAGELLWEPERRSAYETYDLAIL